MSTSVRRVVGPLAAVPVAQALLPARVRVPVGLGARRRRLLGRLCRLGGRCRRRGLPVRLLLRLRRCLWLAARVGRLPLAERGAAARARARADATRTRLALLVPREPAAERHARGGDEGNEDTERTAYVDAWDVRGAVIRNRDD